MTDNQELDFGNEQIAVLFRKMLIPTLVGMLFSAAFIITDGIFVGKGIGGDALGAINIVAPLHLLSTGLGMMFGAGGSVIASIYLSEKNKYSASLTAQQSLLFSIIMMTLFAIFLILFREPMMNLLGAPIEIRDLAMDYYIISSIFNPLHMLFIQIAFFTRLDGAPKLTMMANIISALLNIVLDYLFIFPLGWGMKGASFATGIGTFVGTMILIIYLLKHPNNLHITMVKFGIKQFRSMLQTVQRIIPLGMPILISDLAVSTMMFVGNMVFIRYLNTDGVIAFSVVCYTFPIVFMVFTAIFQSIQPIISFNYGAGNQSRVKTSLSLAIITSIICGIFFSICTQLWGHHVITLFLDISSSAYPLAVAGVNYFSVGFIFIGLNIVIIGYFQSIEKSTIATSFTLLRGVVLMTINFFTLPLIFGVKGIWLAVPLAELMTLALILIGVWIHKSEITNKLKTLTQS